MLQDSLVHVTEDRISPSLLHHAISYIYMLCYTQQCNMSNDRTKFVPLEESSSRKIGVKDIRHLWKSGPKSFVSNSFGQPSE